MICRCSRETAGKSGSLAEQEVGVGDDGGQGVVDIMCDAAGHLAEGAEALLLDHDLLGLPQLVVGLLQAIGQTRTLSYKLRHCSSVVIILSCKAEFSERTAVISAMRLFVFVADFLQNQHDHADGDEELQDGRHKKAGAGKVFVLLGKRIAGQIKSPEQKTQGQHARADERHFACATEKSRLRQTRCSSQAG